MASETVDTVAPVTPAAPVVQTEVAAPEAKVQETAPSTPDLVTPVTPPEPAKEDASSVVPEKYELKLQKNSTMPQSHVDQIMAEAKEKGLSNDQAQALLDRDQTLRSNFETEQKTHNKLAADKWFEDAKSDKEIGGNNFKANVELAKRALGHFASENMIKVLNDTGLGNNPELIRTFMKVGKLLGDDKLITASHHAGSGKASVADRLYPTTKQKE